MMTLPAANAARGPASRSEFSGVQYLSTTSFHRRGGGRSGRSGRCGRGGRDRPGGSCRDPSRRDSPRWSRRPCCRLSGVFSWTWTCIRETTAGARGVCPWRRSVADS
ncbi:hypothetical protein VTN02DRAFT_1397 [Thermoascus thermophilus]